VREEAERLAREEARRRAAEEKIARVEAGRLAREEAERRAVEEQIAREETERLAREEAERLAREEAERLAAEEQIAREEAERLAREEAERRAVEEQIAREESERRAVEEQIAREEAERPARGDAERNKKPGPIGIRRRNNNRKRVTQINLDRLEVPVEQGTEANRDSITLPHIEHQTGELQALASFASASDSQPTPQEKIKIHFKSKERGTMRSAGSLWVDPSDTQELKRVATKYMRKNVDICDKDGRLIKVQRCFEDAIAGGENTLYLIPKLESESNLSSLIPGSVSDPSPNYTSQNGVASHQKMGEDRDPTGTKRSRH